MMEDYTPAIVRPVHCADDPMTGVFIAKGLELIIMGEGRGMSITLTPEHAFAVSRDLFAAALAYQDPAAAEKRLDTRLDTHGAPGHA